MVTKEQIKKFLQENCEYLLKSDDGDYAYYRIDTRDERHENLYDDIPDLKIVVEWSEGFDAEHEKTNPFVDDQGYGLCVSLRVNDNHMFSVDSYYIDEDYSLSKDDMDDGFEKVSEYLLSQIDEYLDDWYKNEYYCQIHECRLYPAHWVDRESGVCYCPMCCKLIKIESALYKNEEGDEEEE